MTFLSTTFLSMYVSVYNMVTGRGGGYTLQLPKYIYFKVQSGLSSPSALGVGSCEMTC